MCQSHMLKTTNIDETNVHLRNGEMYHDHGLEDSALLRCQLHPN